VESLKDKDNLHTLEELRNNIHSEISTISGKELPRVNNVFHSCMEGIQSGGIIFINCCNTGEF
jgi:hypothetical protein